MSNTNLRLHSLSQMMLSRLNLFSGLDSKRAQAWDEYGYIKEPKDKHFIRAYKRHPLASGGVDITVDTSWQSQPKLVEGSIADSHDIDTAEEESWLALFQKVQLWRKFQEADRRRLITGYSGLLLFFADGKEWSEPKSGLSALVRVEPIWSSTIKVKKRYSDKKDWENYGKPEIYEYKEQAVEDSRTNLIEVHADRVFIIGDIEREEKRFLEAGLNCLTDTEKIMGGSGESTLKNAARQIALEFDKETSLADIAAQNGIDTSQLAELMNEQAKDLAMGIDAMMAIQGGSAKVLSTTPIDPKNSFEVAASSFAASIKMPVKILLGMQTGERASQEDWKQWAKAVEGRREHTLSFEILSLAEKLASFGLISNAKGFTVVWQPILEQGTEERLANAKLMADTNHIGAMTGQVFFTDEEIRSVAGYQGSVVDAEFKEIKDYADADEN